jgi:hypothetical protein
MSSSVLLFQLTNYPHKIRWCLSFFFPFKRWKVGDERLIKTLTERLQKLISYPQKPTYELNITRN